MLEEQILNLIKKHGCTTKTLLEKLNVSENELTCGLKVRV